MPEAEHNFRVTVFIEGVRDPQVTHESLPFESEEDAADDIAKRIDDGDFQWKAIGDLTIFFRRICGFRVEKLA